MINNIDWDSLFEKRPKMSSSYRAVEMLAHTELAMISELCFFAEGGEYDWQSIQPAPWQWDAINIRRTYLPAIKCLRYGSNGIVARFGINDENADDGILLAQRNDWPLRWMQEVMPVGTEYANWQIPIDYSIICSMAYQMHPFASDDGTNVPCPPTKWTNWSIPGLTSTGKLDADA